MNGILGRSFGRSLSVLVGLVGITMAVAVPAQAQPFNAWLNSSPGYPTTSGYVRVAANAALNPTGAFTFEAWVAMTNSASGVTV